ncbi:MAG: hypothetical protein B7Z75_08980 [Acidocella sp. 20-57-95]|nr:MAG: hypothetical protein B7Z75_08980 [Acidocella sp. 20-57-95]OYV62429.1 MAG: hypothetical protein B7Z71_01205 [Acidocella sp. 21-58-7]HQT64211.1 hypothetical protein [Acidocella sp.]HQU03862.1 hypothetical protein [Acidocella sp.]
MIMFIPPLGWAIWAAVAALAVLVSAVGIWRRARGAVWRLAGLALLLGILAGPHIVQQTTRKLPDVALVVIDRSPSMQIGNRTALAAAALVNLQAQAAKLPGLQLRVVAVPPADEGGTALFGGIGQALADIPAAQLAGVIALTDGQISDAPKTLPFAAPMTALLTAKREETDRELRLVAAPAYGLVGKDITLQLAVFDHGLADTGTDVPVRVAEDGQPVWTGMVPVGQVVGIAVPVRHAGAAVVTASVTPLTGEVSTINDQSAFSLNGITKKLKVLLVSGNPNQSERSWRLLLKSDPAVELAHFTILRTPGETLDAPPTDVALVPFPVAQLFDIDIAKFDLIILDEFDANGLLPPQYLTNMANYVQNGGALLVQVGPEFAGPDSLANTALGAVLPAVPSPPGTVTEQFSPSVTALGARHPVTAPFAGMKLAPWARLAAATPTAGDVLMTGGAQNWPILVLASAGQGRVGMLLSDQLWLWTRGGTHDGPALPLLRRVVHWLLREPALEPEFLAAKIVNGQLQVTRQSLADAYPGDASITQPDGGKLTLQLKAQSPGLYVGSVPASEPGVWQISEAGLNAFAAVSLPNALEYQNLAASAVPLQGRARAVWLGQDGVPDLAGMLQRRGAAQVTGSEDIPLLPPLPAMLGMLVLLAAGWWRERG